MIEGFEKIAGSMINVILGALILWVGQTTYKHAGVLASLDQKFEAVEQHFKTTDDRCDGLRTWLQKVVDNVKDDNRQLFSIDDAAKQNEQIRRIDEYTYHVEQRLADRLNALEIKVSALETASQDTRQLATLHAEIAQLKATASQGSPIAQAPEAQYPQYQNAANAPAGQPMYLPPVGSRR
jgi:chaperonin cofactor prefoldin